MFSNAKYVLLTIALFSVSLDIQIYIHSHIHIDTTYVELFLRHKDTILKNISIRRFDTFREYFKIFLLIFMRLCAYFTGLS